MKIFLQQIVQLSKHPCTKIKKAKTTAQICRAPLLGRGKAARPLFWTNPVRGLAAKAMANESRMVKTLWARAYSNRLNFKPGKSMLPFLITTALETTMQLMNFQLGSLETNCYILHNDTEAVCFDPGDDAHIIISYLNEHKLKLTSIFCTHLHLDHVGANHDLAEATGAKIFASDRDSFLTRSEMGMGGTMGLPKVKPYQFENIDPGEIEVLGTACRVMATPGHTPGGLCYYFPELGILFSGDTLFHRAVGRTDFPRGNTGLLMESIKDTEKGLFSLPDDTRVLPGHGVASTIGVEKEANPFLNGELDMDY